eukprot:scaffold9860_cov92-Isochrysis_galbana.AAC.3
MHVLELALGSDGDAFHLHELLFSRRRYVPPPRAGKALAEPRKVGRWRVPATLRIRAGPALRGRLSPPELYWPIQPCGARRVDGAC